MIDFRSDYLEGAHESVLALLAIPPVYKLVWRLKKRFGYETREQAIVG